MTPDPRTFCIMQDRDGFYIADNEGFEVETHPSRRYAWHFHAVEALDEMVEDDRQRRREEDGPSDDEIYNGPGIEGGVRYRT